MHMDMHMLMHMLMHMGHVQAAWLLSVDRQEVQSLQDNAWNLAIAQQLPQLLLCALRHLAASVAAAAAAGALPDGAVARAYRLLPLQISRPSPPPQPQQPQQQQQQQHRGKRGGERGAASASGESSSAPPPAVLCFMGERLSLAAVEAALSAEPLVPVLALADTPTTASREVPQSGIAFARASDAVLVPPQLLKWLPQPLLRRWLKGRAPLAAPLLGPAADSALWQLLTQPNLASAKGARQLGDALWETARAMAAPPAPAAAAAAAASAPSAGATPRTEPPPSAAVAEAAAEESAARLAIRLMAAQQERAEAHRRLEKEAQATAGGGGAAPPSASPPAPPPPPSAPPPPLLLAGDGSLQLASAMRWAEPELAKLPEALQAAVLRSAGREGAPVLHARVHARLARFATDGGGGGGDGFTRDEAAALRKASALVDTLRREAAGGGRQLSLATLFARFFAARPDTEAAIAAARYLQQAKRPQLLTHALACGGGGGGGGPPSLLPLARCSVGEAYGNGGLERLQGRHGAFVSAAYLKEPTDRREQAAWRRFFVEGGAADGLSVTVSAAPLPSRERPAGLVLRSSAKAVALPHGLGTLGHKQPLVLDACFSEASARLLQQAAATVATADPPREGAAGGSNGSAAAASEAAAAFCELLSRLSVDTAEHATAAACPALAGAIKGDAPAEAAAPAGGAGGARRQQQQQEYVGNGGNGGGGGGGGVAVASEVPARRRLLYLPPAQAGATVHDLGVAAWVRELRRTRWVPLAAGGLATPAEVRLSDADGAGSHLPVAQLPPATAAALAAAPVSMLLEWGSAPPPSPMARFRALVAAAEARAGSGGGSGAPAGGPGLAAHLGVWVALAEAQAAGDAELDGPYVRRAAETYALLPLGRTMIRTPRVVCRLGRTVHPTLAAAAAAAASSSVGATGAAAEAAGAADEALSEALVRVGYLLDIGASPALGANAAALSTLLHLPRHPPAATVERWLQQVRRACGAWHVACGVRRAACGACPAHSSPRLGRSRP